MIAEHWTNEDRREHSLFPLPVSPAAHELLTRRTPIKCCEIEAETWEGCIVKYNIQHFDAQKEIRPKADEGAD